jgi:hypothetical protein
MQLRVRDFAIITIWLFALLILGYYILVNTALADKVLFGSPTQVLGISSEAELKDKEITLQISESEIKFPLTAILKDNWQKEIAKYGKGNDLLKVLSQGFQALTDQSAALDLVIDDNKLVAQLPLHDRGEDMSRVTLVDGWIRNCSDDNYKILPNKNLLHNLTREAIISGQNISTSWEQVSANSQLAAEIAGCKLFKANFAPLTKHFSPIIPSATLSKILAFNVQEANWQITDDQVFNTHFTAYKEARDITLLEGDSAIKGGRIHLYKPYRASKVLDQATTLAAIKTWLRQPTETLPLIYTSQQPKVLSAGLPIYDFTNVLGRGTTRLHLFRDNRFNTVTDVVIYGLQDLTDVIVQPGQEFSYLNTVNPDRDNRTKSGKPIGNGFCMATTTLFRAALNSGMKITKRNQHGYNFPSYIWSENNQYPFNIVDAAYYTSPEVDFRFVNNTAHPIMLRVSGIRQEDGYQYHYIEILGSSQVPHREVTLDNWKVKDNGAGIYGGRRYEGSFDWIVKENGKVIEQQTFFSKYRG